MPGFGIRDSGFGKRDRALGIGDRGLGVRIRNSQFAIRNFVAVGLAIALFAACATPIRLVNDGDRTVSVPLAVKPGDAKVFLDGLLVGKAADFTADKGGLSVSLGAHTLRLEADDYLSESIDIITQARPATIEVRMLPRPKEKKDKK